MGMARCIFNRLAVRTIPAGFRGIVLWPVLAVLFAGCSLDDDRDLCCPGTLTMHYTYRPFGAEAFGGNIFSLRHFLFGSDGRFIGELPPGEDLRRQPLDLPEGIFTIVTVGNMSERSLHEHGEDSSLDCFALAHTAMHDPDAGTFSNADELFWGVRRFAIDTEGRGIELPPERSAGAVNRLLTEMSNIHCHLKVKVEWANLPPYVGDYELELDGAPLSYSLSPERMSVTSGGFTVPEGRGSAVHRLRVPLTRRELDAEFVTLRYSDAGIPTLRLFFGGEQVSPDIDIGRAFRSWGWFPSDTHIQEYELLIRIKANGNAELYPKINGSVEDWINGGSFG